MRETGEKGSEGEKEGWGGKKANGTMAHTAR